MNVAGAWRCVEDEVVKVSPFSIADELLECVASHAATPQGSLVGINKEADGEEFYAVFLDRHDEVTTIDGVSVWAFALHAKHLRYRRTEDVGVEKSYTIAEFSKTDGEVGSDSALADTTFARTDSDDVLYSREEFVGFWWKCCL